MIIKLKSQPLEDLNKFFELLNKFENYVLMQEKCFKCDKHFFLYKLEPKVFRYLAKCNSCNKEIYFNEYEDFKTYLYEH